MSDELTNIRNKFEALFTDLSRSCFGLKSRMSDIDSFKVEVAESRDDINLLESKLAKTFVTLPDGRALFAWEYEALEEFSKNNRLDFDRLLNDCVTILNGNVVVACINNRSVQDISALSALTGLIKLDLNFSEINDISSLSGLTNLQELDLRNNQIQDLSSLFGLINLQELDLSSNQIQDLSSLSGLTNLQVLYLYDNQIQYKETARKIITSLKDRGVRVYE